MRWLNLIANAAIVWWCAREAVTPGGVVDGVVAIGALAMLGYELERDFLQGRRK